MLQDTVLIRHLPSSLTHQEKTDLLQHFGAKDVKIIGAETKKTNLVYARFENSKAAEVAVQKLHQLDVLGQKISAEIARGPNTNPDDPIQISTFNVYDDKQDLILKAREAFLKKLGLSIKNYDFSQPPPLNIYYQYPPPTRIVLENICKAMANIPKLYNQVLHLMNKMNLPCPFTNNYPLECDLFKEEKPVEPVAYEKVKTFEEEKTQEDMSTSEDESEMGSDFECQTGEIIPLKRKRGHRKVIKRPKFLKPQIPTVQSVKVPTLKTDDVFESAQKEQVPKKIEMRITSDLSSIQEAQEIQAAGGAKEGFEVIKAPQKTQENPVEPDTNEDSNLEDSSSTFISAEQLAANRISLRGCSPVTSHHATTLQPTVQAGQPAVHPESTTRHRHVTSAFRSVPLRAVLEQCYSKCVV
ncbi:RNA-binding region-containing protein 3 [Homalodisca vitripennis]|nr:RNA-binding region-containing protein 3 [Homalodisca vitripennis]